MDVTQEEIYNFLLTLDFPEEIRQKGDRYKLSMAYDKILKFVFNKDNILDVSELEFLKAVLLCGAIFSNLEKIPLLYSSQEGNYITVQGVFAIHHILDNFIKYLKKEAKIKVVNNK